MAFGWILNLLKGIFARRPKQEIHKKKAGKSVKEAYKEGLKALKKVESSLDYTKLFIDKIDELKQKHRSNALKNLLLRYCDEVREPLKKLKQRLLDLEQKESGMFKEENIGDAELNSLLAEARGIRDAIEGLIEKARDLKNEIANYLVKRVGYDDEFAMGKTSNGMVAYTLLIEAVDYLNKFLKFEKRAEKEEKKANKE